jgi:hypothetical protein
MKTLFTSLILAAFAAVTQTGHAQIRAVDFGGDYTSSNINNTTPAGSGYATGDYNFDGSSDDRAYIRPFGSEASFTGSDSFTTPTGKSGAFINYGISYANIGSLSDPANNGLNRITSSDSIQATSGAGTSAMRMASAWYWQKASFLNGLNVASGISFADQSGSLFASINNTGTPTTGNQRASRFLVQSGGQWYLSESFSTATDGTLSINAATSNWYVFDPTANALFWDVTKPGGTVIGSLLTDITAIGIYTQHQLFDGTSGSAAVQGFSSFEATVVPEPSSFALLLGAIVALAIIRRGRNRARMQ